MMQTLVSSNDKVFYAITLQSLVQQGLLWTITMKNHVYRNHTTLQLELTKNSYINIVQLSLGITTTMQLSPLEI